MSDARLLYLISARNLSPTQAVDVMMVHDSGIPADEWANARNVTERAVTKNLADAAADEDLPSFGADELAAATQTTIDEAGDA